MERVAQRGDIWWGDLGRPKGSAPGYRRPLLVIQSDAFNRSTISTVITVGMTTNMSLASAPGNVVCRPKATGLPKPSVVNVSQVATVDRKDLLGRVGQLPSDAGRRVDDGLRLVLKL